MGVTDGAGQGVGDVGRLRDLIESEDGPIVLEVNASPGWQGLKGATGKEIAELIVEYGVRQVE